MVDKTANLDACSMILSAYATVRAAIRETLSVELGTGWEDLGIPRELHGYLVGRRERETTIDWQVVESEDLLDYAGFANLGDIIAERASLREHFRPVAADAQVLRTRFLELDGVCNRVAYSRAISARDLELLASFTGRLRRLGPARAAAPPRSRPEGGESEAEKKHPAGPPVRSAADEARAPQAAKGQAPDKATASGDSRATPATPQQRAASEPEVRERPRAAAVVARERTERALGSKDDTRVLTCLYEEVTELAEQVWTTGAMNATTPVWQQVRESPWFRDAFARVGLKPVSDFYDVVATAADRSRNGASRDELHAFLNERQFANILLALRNLFKQSSGVSN